MQLGPVDNTLRYILYDLRGELSIANIHLPRADDENPVLIQFDPKDFESISHELREMCVNEGEDWLNALLVRPEFAPDNTTDLEVGCAYILIAHIQFVYSYPPYDFLIAMKNMKKLVLH